MSQTPPGSRPTSPVPVNTPVHRASRRIRGLPPDADVTLCTTSTGMTSTSVQTIPTGTESTMVNRRRAEDLRSTQTRTAADPTERNDQLSLDIPVLFDGYAVSALVDTGADYSIPREIEDYLAQQRMPPPARPQSRSPSPRRFSSPPQRYAGARTTNGAPTFFAFSAESVTLPPRASVIVDVTCCGLRNGEAVAEGNLEHLLTQGVCAARSVKSFVVADLNCLLQISVTNIDTFSAALR
ncbi:hypothetical protein HPB52_018605 [Rhipicephalus sanguineus]|uniref:Peptidase A2 domain-containing protein n=1 Tax=Rhipicephalus sanguineus TaxID=34632 RepID=A0A9D4PEU4_RHISA|nr:hypothetical protein HPB52_018605 [Rhipicephalus sanguineus]